MKTQHSQKENLLISFLKTFIFIWPHILGTETHFPKLVVPLLLPELSTSFSSLLFSFPDSYLPR